MVIFQLCDTFCMNCVSPCKNIYIFLIFITVKELQTRWKNIKDCFRREVSLQKNDSRSGASPSRRKKYIYADRLLFLVPTFTTRQTSGNVENEQQEENEENVGESENIGETSSGTSSGSPSASTSNTLHPLRLSQAANKQSGKRKRSSSEIASGDVKEMISMLCTSLSARGGPKNTYQHEETPEFSFLTGLLPTIMTISQAQRQSLQVEMTKLVYRYLPQANPSGVQSPNIPIPPQHYPMPQVPGTGNSWYQYQYPSQNTLSDPYHYPSQNSHTDL
ncbi:uncharacterized protein LOC121397709 [Xenopus laevis]|uniref:Uncharacterized protein LOC121397709 n=1 Tax=Xenopus laevis TaxID=8355 RepID=A0A8J1LMX3_XENLA|nr:uncharacterized protein LOC121397709 [Xenopus laevis]